VSLLLLIIVPFGLLALAAVCNAAYWYRKGRREGLWK
jgi:hypothetical protein